MAVNILNGKVYVGQTVQTLIERKNGHLRKSKTRNYHFYSAIKKYGADNFEWRQIDDAENADELNQKERYWIAYYKSDNPEYGYNMNEGGLGARHTEETKRKISELRKGKKMPPHSPETRRKMSESLKGKTAWNKGLIFAVKTPKPPKPKRIKIPKPPKILKGKQIGEKHHKNTTSEATALQIKVDIKAGLRICEIMRKHGVTKSVVSNIKHGYSWKWLQVEIGA